MRNTKIFEFVESMAALIRSEERKKCAEFRLQLVHYEVLNYLSQSNKYTDTPAATAYYFGMTRGTVSQSLIVLEKKGYIEKKKDEVDKRIIHVHLLPSGQSILKKVRRIELFNKAIIQLQNNTAITLQKNIFVKVLSALQKVSQSQSFKAEYAYSFNLTKNQTIFDLIDRMATLIRTEERKKCTELKIQMVHFQVLDYLSLSNKYSDTPAAIANYLGITRGTLSQTLLILEKKEFIKKHQDQNDKRVFHIQLLQKGLNILNKAKPSVFFNKAAAILEENSLITAAVEELFVESLSALQKANNSYSFGVCHTCKNFSIKSIGYFCELTQEKLTEPDSVKICQEHIPI